MSQIDDECDTAPFLNELVFIYPAFGGQKDKCCGNGDNDQVNKIDLRIACKKRTYDNGTESETSHKPEETCICVFFPQIHAPFCSQDPGGHIKKSSHKSPVFIKPGRLGSCPDASKISVQK